MAQVTGLLPSKTGALSSNPVSTKKEKQGKGTDSLTNVQF
jgi:hypothetical protein